MAVFFDRGALSGASLFGQKGPDFVGGYPFMTRIMTSFSSYIERANLFVHSVDFRYVVAGLDA